MLQLFSISFMDFPNGCPQKTSLKLSTGKSHSFPLAVKTPFQQWIKDLTDKAMLYHEFERNS